MNTIIKMPDGTMLGMESTQIMKYSVSAAVITFQLPGSTYAYTAPSNAYANSVMAALRYATFHPAEGITDILSLLTILTISDISPGVLIWQGQTCTITGTGFVSGTTVTIGGNAVAGLVVINSTTIQAYTTGMNISTADVVVTNPDGSTATLAGVISQAHPVPAVTTPSPASGPPGTTVTLTASGGGSPNFQPSGTLMIGSVPCAISVYTSTDVISFVLPVGNPNGSLDISYLEGGVSQFKLLAAFTQT